MDSKTPFHRIDSRTAVCFTMPPALLVRIARGSYPKNKKGAAGFCSEAPLLCVGVYHLKISLSMRFSQKIYICLFYIS